MQTNVFTKSVSLPTDLAAAFEFHRDPRNLDYVQPPGAEVIEADLPSRLELNSICSLKVKALLGIQHWKIQVDELVMDLDSGKAVMVDRAIHSPFAHWVHRHEFETSGEQTVMCDEVEFLPPGGPLAWLLIMPTKLMLHALFTYRHYQTIKYFSEQAESVRGLS